MGKITGFLEFTRELPKYRSVEERLKDYKEIPTVFAEEKTNNQAARCMDCGVPFCHNGCPLGNIIPEFNDAVYNNDWKLAAEILLSTNNFPEYTGRICPAPCETACVLGINQPPVAIEHIEKSIIEKAFELNLIQPIKPNLRSGKNIAVVGSGPAGMAAAAQLNKAGHTVTVFERADRIGGLLRYGIPDFKLEKTVIDRRISLMKEEGIIFKTNTNVGIDIKIEELRNNFDAIILTGGSTVPRDLPIKGRNLNGIYPAMEFLSQQNKRVSEIATEVDHRGVKYENGDILATDKNVLVIGGGDTGSDCVGTSNRHQAKSITQIELLGKPPLERAESTPWPNWPMMLRTSSSHEEGCERQWSILTKEFIGNEKEELIGLKIVEIEWKTIDGKAQMVEVEGSERVLPCELVLLAMGFVHPQHDGLLKELNVELDERGNVKANNYKTNVDKVFTAGDIRRGQSLVVWAISEGRECAREVDTFLMGESQLEAKDKGVLQVN
ncbi:MAG TPA: glutamate synthase subunit beta [Chitinophagales bacterium]|jgi:glutamate synthase (NADPH/NADH) small chain|nr:glutamate synthase subunit beta [Chitinophagales bacterium]HQW79270.1 glutamate synthase subunit beta [Chitinophagales bacterium]HRB66630.1 glutamate synthase subunit beta [Chitinophagales bacterium]HRB91783.1 glutamate synthase subunit beta [Chitinophagales bacterium]